MAEIIETQIGFLSGTIVNGEKAPEPLVKVAHKLVYYMDAGLKNPPITQVEQLEGLADGFYQRKGVRGDRGIHLCDIEEGLSCRNLALSGVFDWKYARGIYQMPTGIIHYLIDHRWDPGEEFKIQLGQLPEVPQEFMGTSNIWVAPNLNGLFQLKRASR